MTDAAPIALASGEVAVGRQKWVRRSLWLAGGVGVVSLLAAGYWEELKELNAYGQCTCARHRRTSRLAPDGRERRVHVVASIVRRAAGGGARGLPPRNAQTVADDREPIVRALRACADVEKDLLGGGRPEPSTAPSPHRAKRRPPLNRRGHGRCANGGARDDVAVDRVVVERDAGRPARPPPEGAPWTPRWRGLPRIRPRPK